MLTKKPKNPLPSWPPLYHTKVHEVKDGDNWWNLAEAYKRKDPWDIIQYNFNTKDPEEVNYYLAELVGCSKSRDGKNYSFSSEDKPGKVYIPPPSWVPAHGPYAKQDWHFLFTEMAYWGGWQPGEYELAIQALGKLVYVEDQTVTTPCEYNYANEMRIRDSRTYMCDAWMIKEIQHVINGPYGKGKSYSAEMEARSWVSAEAWHTQQSGEKLPFPLHHARTGDRQKRAILAAARVHRQMKGTFAEAQRFRELVAAVRQDPDYQRRQARGSGRVA